MELYLLHPEKHRQLYGCINITVEDVPLEERQHIPEGIIFIALAAFYYYVIAFHLFWEGTFAVAIPLLYIVFALLFYAKSRKLEASKQVSKQQKLMLLQVFIISMLNFVTCSVYVSMMYIVPSKILIHFATFCWLHIHGFPPVIYLAFNPTIQKDAKQMWFSVLRRCKGQTKTKKS
uniref:G-protein coupled receptors family 1 profile domain-containing protein n=1 Tax=Ditylenchus dipsaci TaxID=166011 RepID=A0A915D1Y7_9BILA